MEKDERFSTEFQSLEKEERNETLGGKVQFSKLRQEKLLVLKTKAEK